MNFMAEKPKSLKWNFFMNAVLTASSLLFPLVSFPYVSRVLGPEGMGKVSFASSLVSYFAIFAQLGIPTYGIRVCAALRDRKTELTRTVQELTLLNLIMSAAAYGALFALVWAVPKLRAERELYFIMSLTILFNAIGMEWLYKALEQYAYIAARSIFFKVVGLGAVFALVHRPEDVLVYGAVSLIALSGSSVLNLLNARRFVGLRPVGDYHLGRHLGPVGVFFAMSCATTLYTQLDTVMLGFLQTDREVGYYHAAVKIKSILVSVVTSLGVVLLPRAAYYIQQGRRNQFEQMAAKALRFVWLAAPPLAVYFILFARESILFLSGGAYAAAVLPMQIILPVLVLVGLTNVMGLQMLVPLGREKAVLRSELAGAAVNLAANFLLIPGLSSVGAALGTLLAETVVWAIQRRALRDQLRWVSLPLARLAGALGAGCLSSIWVKALDLPPFFALALSAGLFFGSYGVVHLAAREPLALELLALLRRKTRLPGK